MGRSSFGYSTSRVRMVLLAVMLVAGVWMLNRAGAQTGGGATPGAAPVTATPSAATADNGPREGKGLLSIIPLKDPVTWTIFTLSFVAVTLIVQGFIKARAENYMPAASVGAMQDMIANRQFKELLDFTETDPSFVARALSPALKRAPNFQAMKEALETAVGEETANSFRRIEFLNIIGTLGPLLGLLGTVLGLIQAFSAMQAAGGQANPADLAGGISTALAHTFMGLALAIPCVAAFGILRTITDRLTVEASLKAEELLLMTKPPEARVVGAVPGSPAGMPGPVPPAAPMVTPVLRPAPVVAK